MTTTQLRATNSFSTATAEQRSLPVRIDRERRVISGYAVISRGAILGRPLWVDEAFLVAVAAVGNESRDGIKARFMHPDEIIRDGLGYFIGRSKNFRLDGNIVRADMHLAAAASTSPHGDLAKYVMDLCEEDPAALGASIVFLRDTVSEDSFWRTHGGRSPDPENRNHYPHLRLGTFMACDIVDTPAGNRGGMVGQQKVAAEMMCSLSAAQVVETAKNQERMRSSAIIGRFRADPEFAMEMLQSGATLEQAERAYGNRFMRMAEDHKAKHGGTIGAAMSRVAVAHPDLHQAFLEASSRQIAEARQVHTLTKQQQLATVQKHPFMTAVDEVKAARGCSTAEAMSSVARSNPELHHQFIEDSRAGKFNFATPRAVSK